MQVDFKDVELKNFYEMKKSKLYYFNSIQKQFISKVNLVKFAPTLRAVENMRGLNFEPLHEKKYKGKHSIRINNQRRVIIELKKSTEITFFLEEITDYH